MGSVILQDAKGNDVHLNIYKGKVLLIVNVASKWYVCMYAYSTYLILFFSRHQRICLVCSDMYPKIPFPHFFSGMTNSNYTELNQLYDKYRHQGLHFMFVLILWCLVSRSPVVIFEFAFHFFPVALRPAKGDQLLHCRPGNTSIPLQSVW